MNNILIFIKYKYILNAWWLLLVHYKIHPMSITHQSVIITWHKGFFERMCNMFIQWWETWWMIVGIKMWCWHFVTKPWHEVSEKTFLSNECWELLQKILIYFCAFVHFINIFMVMFVVVVIIVIYSMHLVKYLCPLNS